MVTNVVVTWHGIWYEIMHSKLLQELLLIPKGGQLAEPTAELHEAMLRLRNVHVILNGVDETKFTQDQEAGKVPRKTCSAFQCEHCDGSCRAVGAGPWRRRYAELGPNVKILGALEPLELSILQCARCVYEEFGYTFSPNVKSFVEALELAIRDGSSVLKRKGLACKKYVVSMFAATKMASAYKRFFLCMKNEKYCQYPLPTDC
ncbi:hypothetical protein ACFX2I_030857 [Malus domestica]